jgi:hypothetical protein
MDWEVWSMKMDVNVDRPDLMKKAEQYITDFSDQTFAVGEVSGDIGCHGHWRGNGAVRVIRVDPPDFENGHWYVSLVAQIETWESNTEDEGYEHTYEAEYSLMFSEDDEVEDFDVGYLKKIADSFLISDAEF